MKAHKGFSILDTLLALAIIAGIALWTASTADVAQENVNEYMAQRCDEARSMAEKYGVKLGESYDGICNGDIKVSINAD